MPTSMELEIMALQEVLKDVEAQIELHDLIANDIGKHPEAIRFSEIYLELFQKIKPIIEEQIRLKMT